MFIGFIGVIKQVSFQYSMAHIQRKVFTLRLNCYGFVSVDEGVSDMMKFA